jgi:excisionase family DNA binding protein
MDERSVLTPKEAGKLMGIHWQTVLTHLRNGEIPGEKIGNRWYIHKPWFEAWQRGEVAATRKDAA